MRAALLLLASILPVMANSTIPALPNTWTPWNAPLDAYGEAGSASQVVGLGSARFLAHHALLGVYNVKAFGAKGDGATDDVLAIQAAITAAGPGRTVWFPPGVYVCSAGLNILNRNVTLKGNASGVGYNASATASVLKFTGGTIGIGLRKRFGEADNSDYSMVQDLTIDGNSVLDYGISFKGQKVISRCQIKSCNLVGIRCEDNGNSFHIDECSIYQNGAAGVGVGIWIGTTDTTIFAITNCSIRENYRGLEITSGLNFLVMNCVIEANQAEAVKLKNADPVSLAYGRFVNVWAEANGADGTGKYAWHIENGSAPGNPVPKYFQFVNCRMAADSAGSKAVYVGPKIDHVLFDYSRFGGTSASDIYVDPLATETVFRDCTGQNVNGLNYATNFTSQGTSGASLKQAAGGTTIITTGQQPTGFDVAVGETMTFTLPSADVCALLLIYNTQTGRGSVFMLDFTTVTILSDPGGLFSVTAAPTTTIGISNSGGGVYAIKNATAATRNLTLQLVGQSIKSLTDPAP